MRSKKRPWRLPKAVVVVLGLVVSSAVVALPGSSALAATSVTDIADPNSVTCGQSGLIDFENLPDQTDLSPTAINGVRFTTTGGYTWRVGDFAAGGYNGKYPQGSYTSRGTHWAWLGTSQGAGRMDFSGLTSYVSLLVSANTSVVLEVYSASGALLEKTAPTPSNVGAGHMSQLAVHRPSADIAYAIVHDSGNYFNVDAICTDAPGVGSVGKYVALGDSFSSGEGVPPFQAGTDSAQDHCHRSTAAYPELITGRLGIPQEVEHWACSGALIKDFYNTNHSNTTETAQRQKPGLDTTLLTLGVGGNDVGFEEIASACVKTSAWLWQGGNPSYDPNCKKNLSTTTAIFIGELKDGLPGNFCAGSRCSLPNLYRDLRVAAPAAHGFVIGYPNFMAEKPTDKCSGSIKKQDGSNRGKGANWSFSKDDTAWIHGVITTLNEKIKATANEAGFRYVDVNNLFVGHEPCSDDPWLNGVVVDGDDKPSPYSFHPNAEGQKQLANAMAHRISEGATDLYIRPGQTVPSQYAIGAGRSSFTASTSWTGSDMSLRLTSPAGRVIDRSTSAADVTHVLGTTNESFTVHNPAAGSWKVEVTGLDVPATGESADLELTQLGDEAEVPLATIVATPDCGVGTVAVALDGSASGAQHGQIAEYTWTFDDGAPPATGAKVNHTFTTPGLHVVTLAVRDADGRTDTTHQDIQVSATNQAPTAALLAQFTEGTAPLAVGLDASDSEDVDGHIAQYRWDFDGNSTVDQVTTTPTTTYTYTRAGSFTPKVTVVDDLGLTGSASAAAIAVTGGTTGPVTAAADAYTIAAGQTLTVPAPGVLGNDTPADPGDTLTASVATGPAKGELALAANGSFTYTPAAGFSGTDLFTYTASGPAGSKSAPATVTLTVAPAGCTPLSDVTSVTGRVKAGRARVNLAIAKISPPRKPVWQGKIAIHDTRGGLRLRSGPGLSVTPVTDQCRSATISTPASGYVDGHRVKGPATILVTNRAAPLGDVLKVTFGGRNWTYIVTKGAITIQG